MARLWVDSLSYTLVRGWTANNDAKDVETKRFDLARKEYCFK